MGLIPPAILALAHDARRFGARILIRECGHSTPHIDIFDAPDELTIPLWDAGYRTHGDAWMWCASWGDGDGERITDRPSG